MEKQQPLIIAHRGASFDAPENTLASVNLAWQLNADGIEIDIQMTKDQQIVVYHDHDTFRFGGDSRKISKRNYSDLKNLKVGTIKGGRWADERIPTFEEVIETIPKGKILVVEIKCGPEIIPKLQSLLDSSKVEQNQLIFIAFDRITIRQIKSYYPEYQALRLYELKRNMVDRTWNPSAEQMIDEVMNDGLDGIDVSICKGVDEKLVAKVKKENLKILVWTVNDILRARELYHLKIDGITTDRPDWIRNNLLVDKGHQ